MKRLNVTSGLHYIGIMSILALLIVGPSTAQDETATLSGIVIDTNRRPIPGLTASLSTPSFTVDRFIRATSSRLTASSSTPFPLFSTTDEKGKFTFSKVTPGPVQFLIYKQSIGEKESTIFTRDRDVEIVSIKIQYLTFYQASGNIAFAIAPRSRIENVVVTVQPRTRIRARVVSKDEKPLASTPISWEIQYEKIDGKGSGATHITYRTDSEGYFVHYANEDTIPAHYTVSATYNQLSVKSDQILMEMGKQVDVVLKFDIDAPDPPPKQSPRTQQLPTNVLQEPPGAQMPLDKATLSGTWPGAWVVNPENGHAYKMIHCANLKNAQHRATAEGAYLVAINSEKEQNWLLGAFGNQLYWIGLSDAEQEGQWVWQSGEPLLYTNWGLRGSAPRSTLSTEETDNAVMSFLNGKWYAVGPADLLWQNARMAILEKDSWQTGDTETDK